MRRVPPFCGPAAADAEAAVVGDGPVLGGAAQPARVAITRSATGSLRRVITKSSSLVRRFVDGASLAAQDMPARRPVSGAVHLQRWLSHREILRSGRSCPDHAPSPSPTLVAGTRREP